MEKCFVTQVRENHYADEGIFSIKQNYSKAQQEEREQILNDFIESVVNCIVFYLSEVEDERLILEDVHMIESWLSGSVGMDNEHIKTIGDFITLCMKVVGREVDGITEFINRTKDKRRLNRR